MLLDDINNDVKKALLTHVLCRNKCKLRITIVLGKNAAKFINDDMRSVYHIDRSKIPWRIFGVPFLIDDTQTTNYRIVHR